VVVIKKLGKVNLLELFHGPTLAFKDIAMQVIGNMYEKILKKNNLKINVVVATSGDTGAAAINAIRDRKNMKIFVLHPDNKISEVQRKFMTTVNSSNVFNIALSGNFDDCQKFVKSMFADKNFRNSINMSGVNSINWARIIFQIVYYFFSYFKIAKTIYKDLDERLEKSKFLAGNEYTIADIATFPWIARHPIHDIGLKNFINLSRWYNTISEREAVIKGFDGLKKGEKIPKI